MTEPTTLVCPSGNGATHHLVPTQAREAVMRCVYCRRTEKELREDTMTDSTTTLAFHERLTRIVGDISLPEQFSVVLGHTPGKGHYVQIKCWRLDVITKQMGYGYGGKAYPSEHASTSELVGMIFGLYKAYCEHEARESFEWRGKRIYGPHIDIEALWEVARRVDVRSAQHVEDRA